MEKSIIHIKTYRYELINDQKDPLTVLYVLHGYGQLAKYFIRKFSNLSKNILIIAPEGMHRFYINGSSGRVGASWMTKELREVDIEDNMSWLDALDENIYKNYRIENRILLGFSQGGSTAVRWNLLGKTKFSAMIIWASDYPPELKDKANQLAGQQLYFCIGTEDEYYDHHGQKELLNFYQNNGFEISNYLGPHDIDKPTLERIIQEIISTIGD